MRILVVGLGSMGKRRIRLLFQYFHEKNGEAKVLEGITGVDSNHCRCQEVEESYGISTYTDLDQALEREGYDCAFISTSPRSHAELIHNCLTHGLHVFTELNLMTKGYSENISLARQKNLVLFLSSTFLYRKEIQFIEEKVRLNENKLSYSYHVGQYLPDWHPWENYKNFFVGQKETNGCREILAIELPWLIHTFGEVINYRFVKTRISNLEINYPDVYMLILEHESGVRGMLGVDVVSPIAIRDFNVWGEQFCVRWRGTPDTVEEFDSIQKKMSKVSLYDTVERANGYEQFVIENAYLSEIENFFDTILGDAKPVYSFEKDEGILRLIDRLEADV